jgi:hypothetical protein
MARYAIGRFEPSQSGSPYQFVCDKVYPEGPFALLDINLRRICPPQRDWYLFELKDWHSIDQRKQFVTRLIATLTDIRTALMEALKGATWEMVQVERRRRKVQIAGRVLKTQYGYFVPEYHGGLNAFGPGQDVDPWITFEPCPKSAENPYGDAWTATSEKIRGHYLTCIDVKRARDAFVAKEGLGELFRNHHGF